MVSCLSKDQREFGPQSGEREEEEEDQAKETTQKAGTAKRRESSPLGTADRDRTLWIIFNQRRGSEGGTGAGWPLGRSTLMAAVTIFQVSNRVDQTILKHFCGVHVV